ncbi:hypothetical protein [Flagellimonas onchidii]|uniref:hypothetical protein n=1 Tax=Flagellimonas onchidii TaxID=2562684 RepID=UPI0010A5B40B|nr:hypothetical protein [Allomuricauda onchidii]
MENEYNINKIIESGEIQNEFDLEVALACHRLLRLMIKGNPKLKTTRKRLGDMIHDYESKNWSADSPIKPNQIKESDLAELYMEKEMHQIRQSLTRFVQDNLL